MLNSLEIKQDLLITLKIQIVFQKFKIFNHFIKNIIEIKVYFF